MKFEYNGKECELLFLTVTGSRMYGNSRPESDWDYRGVFIESINDKLTLDDSIKKIGGANADGEELCKVLQNIGLPLKDTNDVELYELKRFITLALENNPNIMDLLCHNNKHSIYINELGQTLLDNKQMFLSKDLKETFSGYALSQLKKMKSHSKWIGVFPETHIVLEVIENNYKSKNIDFDWICDNFGGEVALKTTNENAQNKISLENTISWNSFLEGFNDYNMISDPNIYRLPRLINYCFPKNLKGKSLNRTNEIESNKYINEFPNLYDMNISFEEFLLNKCSYRTLSPSMLVLYTDGKGMLTKDGSLNPNDPKKIGDFVCLLSIDQMKFKSDRDYINKMWNWKCHRNEKRSDLEDQFGYDLKHASHLVRLLDGCKEILLTNDYVPELSGSRLSLVNDIRNGFYNYEWVLNYAEDKNKELDTLVLKSNLQDTPNKDAINNLYKNILLNQYNLNENSLNNYKFDI